MTNHKAYRPDIDGLRAIAVLLVLSYHLFPKTIRGGFIGVDVFFVISGYLITGIILDSLAKNNFSYLDFFSRRIRRIYPVFVIVLFCTLLTGWFFLLPKELMELAKHVLGGVGFVANLTLWHDAGYFDALPELKPLLHLWSLGIEEQFYLFWPVALMVGWKNRKKFNITIIIIFVISFILNVIFISKKSDAVFYFPITRFWELMIGGALVIVQREGKLKTSEHSNEILSLIGILLISAATLKLHKESLFPGWWALMPTIGAALLIQTQSSRFNRLILSNKLMVWIGLISYPLYLWHWPLISFIYIRYGELPFQANQIIVLVASFILSWLTYKLIETPVRHSKKTRLTVGILLSTSLALGFWALLIRMNDGYPTRISDKDPNVSKALQAMLVPGFGGYIAAEWREHSCFLLKEEDVDKFKPECLGVNKKPEVVIWGDSHAAALYSGFKNVAAEKSISLGQLTASACAPILGWEGVINKLCSKINSHFFEIISKLRPETVILHSAWYWGEYPWEKINTTIQELKKIGIKNIVLVGSSPTWKEKVPNNVILYYLKYREFPTQFTDFNLIDFEETLRIDEGLKKITSKEGVVFTSIMQTMCHGKACLLTVEEDPFKISSVDNGHLSVYGAEYFVKKNFGELIIKK